MTDLLTLAGRCEAATGGDRELDAAINDAIYEFNCRNTIWECGEVPAYTASIDSAKTLIPSNMFEEVWIGDGIVKAVQLIYPVGTDRGRARRKASIYVIAATSPLALCAAALRARATQDHTDG
jgi:hypothetical protein